MGSNVQVMEQEVESSADRRPLSIWVLLFAFLFIGLAGWVRMFSSLMNWYWLTFAGVALGPLYLAVTGALWGMVSLIALVWLWLRRPGFRLVGSSAAIILALTYWADRLLVMSAVDRFQNASFAAAVTIVALVYVLISLSPWQDLRALIDRK